MKLSQNPCRIGYYGWGNAVCSATVHIFRREKHLRVILVNVNSILGNVEKYNQAANGKLSEETLDRPKRFGVETCPLNA